MFHSERVAPTHCNQRKPACSSEDPEQPINKSTFKKKKIITILLVPGPPVCVFNDILPFAASWVDLEYIRPSEKSQTEKDILYVITYLCNVKK